jgi:hypothetical protein
MPSNPKLAKSRLEALMAMASSTVADRLPVSLACSGC